PCRDSRSQSHRINPQWIPHPLLRRLATPLHLQQRAERRHAARHPPPTCLRDSVPLDRVVVVPSQGRSLIAMSSRSLSHESDNARRPHVTTREAFSLESRPRGTFPDPRRTSPRTNADSISWRRSARRTRRFHPGGGRRATTADLLSCTGT